MRSVASVLLVAGLLAAVGCERDEIEVRRVNRAAPEDYGRSKLLTAVAVMKRTPKSPDAFGELAARVAELAPGFNEELKELADRELVFAALGPMEAMSGQPFPEQMDALATTVWPTAFEVPARPGETPAEYARRICGNELALECKHVVPDYWPMLLTALAWKKLGARARSLYAGCITCKVEPSFQSALDRYATEYDQMLMITSRHVDEGDIKAWPLAAERAQPWSDPLLLARRDQVTLDGEPIRGGAWQDALTEARRGRDVLGVYIKPGDTVAVLRSIADAAAEAGFTELALLAREPKFPFEKREYRLGIGPRAKGKKLRVRDVETIQVLIQAVDATLAEHPKVRL